MIVWINGTFGVGKTTISNLLVADGKARVFDPEHVGYMLAGNLRDFEFSDFQDLRPWREVVPSVLASVSHFTGAQIVAPQTVLVEQYWNELRAGIESKGLAVTHVVLDCDRGELESRINNDQIEVDARQWRLDHVAAYLAARDWMTAAADLVIDTTSLTPDAVASAITNSIDTFEP